MTLIVFILSGIISLSSAVPTCPAPQPNAACYSPDGNTTVLIQKDTNGTYLVKVDRIIEGLRENSSRVQIVQDEVLTSIDCSYADVTDQSPDNLVSCASTAKINFNLDKPFYVTFSTNNHEESTSSALYIQKPQEDFLSRHTRRQFSKAHAILMVIAWLFFVPSAFIFARFGRDLYKDHTSFGMAIWFQIHRVANFVGLVCMVASIAAIFISKQKWTGIGSSSRYWTQQHSNLGIVSVVLAVVQPFNSLLRCGPTDSRRTYFNWSHRIIGVVSYALALAAIIIAAIHFKNIWNEPLLEVVLSSVPVVISVALCIIFPIMEAKSNKVFDQVNIVKIPLLFFSVGVFLALTVALSLLLVNGYKA